MYFKVWAVGHNSENKHHYICRIKRTITRKKRNKKVSFACRQETKKERWDGKGGGGERERDWKKEKKSTKKKKISHPLVRLRKVLFFFFFSFLSGVSDSVTADINFDVGTCSRQRLDGGYGWIINISTPKPSSQMIFAHLVCRATGLHVFKYIVSLGPFLGAGLWEVCACGEYASSTHWPRPSTGRYLGTWVWSQPW